MRYRRIIYTVFATLPVIVLNLNNYKFQPFVSSIFFP